MFRFRWLIGNFSDPSYELSRAEQLELSKLAHAKYMPGRRFFWWTALVLLVPVLLVYKLALPAALDWLGYGMRPVPLMIGMGVVIGLFWIWCAVVYGVIYTRPMRQAMREKGHDVCVSCGYLLTGLTGSEPECPECGAPRERM